MSLTVINYFSFCIFGVLFLFSFKDSVFCWWCTGQQSICCLKDVSPLSSHIISNKKSVVTLPCIFFMYVPSSTTPPAAFKTLSLALINFSILCIVSCAWNILNYGICCFIIYINFEKFSAIISSRNFFSSPLCLLWGFLLYIYLAVLNFLAVSWSSIHFFNTFKNYFCVLFWIVSIAYLPLIPSGVIFITYIIVFISITLTRFIFIPSRSLVIFLNV